jgi:hypothetical protein
MQVFIHPFMCGAKTGIKIFLGKKKLEPRANQRLTNFSGVLYHPMG